MIVTFSPSTSPTSFRPWRNETRRLVMPSDDLLSRKPITGIAGCCARAASGHAAAAPPSVAKNRPRRIGLRPSEARRGRERGSARCQMQEISAGKFHSALPAFRATVGLPQSLRLDVGRPDHLGPLLGIVDQEFPELGWRQRHQDVPEADDTCPNFVI